MFRRRRFSSNKNFDPQADARQVKHSRIGVWDIYEERPSLAHIPGLLEGMQTYYNMANSLPYVWRMVKDISTINGCLVLVSLYILVEIIASLVPAVSLW
jgi:hypothetical protein